MACQSLQISNYTLKGSSKYDDAALAEKLKALDIFSDDYIENPEDAHIEIKDGKYDVIEEKKAASRYMTASLPK